MPSLRSGQNSIRISGLRLFTIHNSRRGHGTTRLGKLDRAGGTDGVDAAETGWAWSPTRAHECLERQGEIMPGKIDDKSTTSWFQRRLADGTTVSGDDAEFDAAAIAHSGKARDGWDPWEVWLRYIEQPRNIRRRDVRQK
jgi:hypothetical protein